MDKQLDRPSSGLRALPSLQALVQYADADTASSAKQALDGHSIPRYAQLGQAYSIVQSRKMLYCTVLQCTGCSVHSQCDSVTQ